MSRWRILRSCTCFSARQIWTNQSKICTGGGKVSKLHTLQFSLRFILLHEAKAAWCLPALPRTARLSGSWSSWRGLRPHSSPSQCTGSRPLQEITRKMLEKSHMQNSNSALHACRSATTKHVFMAGFYCRKFSWRHINKAAGCVLGHLQKTLYTALYWGGSCWRGRPPPCGTPASPCTTSVKTKRREVNSERGRARYKRQPAGARARRCARPHPGYANLLDDILASILLGFHEDRLPERALADFLHLFVLVHVNTMAGSSCCGCTARSTASLRVICWISYRHRHLGTNSWERRVKRQVYTWLGLVVVTRSWQWEATVRLTISRLCCLADREALLLGFRLHADSKQKPRPLFHFHWPSSAFKSADWQKRLTVISLSQQQRHVSSWVELLLWTFSMTTANQPWPMKVLDRGLIVFSSQLATMAQCFL